MLAELGSWHIHSQGEGLLAAIADANALCGVERDVLDMLVPPSGHMATLAGLTESGSAAEYSESAVLSSTAVLRHPRSIITLWVADR